MLNIFKRCLVHFTSQHPAKRSKFICSLFPLYVVVINVGKIFVEKGVNVINNQKYLRINKNDLISVLLRLMITDHPAFRVHRHNELSRGESRGGRGAVLHIHCAKPQTAVIMHSKRKCLVYRRIFTVYRAEVE